MRLFTLSPLIAHQMCQSQIARIVGAAPGNLNDVIHAGRHGIRMLQRLVHWLTTSLDLANPAVTQTNRREQMARCRHVHAHPFVKPKDGETSGALYTAVLVQKEGKWKYSEIVDTPQATTTPAEHLSLPDCTLESSISSELNREGMVLRSVHSHAAHEALPVLARREHSPKYTIYTTDR